MSRNHPARPTAPEICPICGEDVPRGAVACPECGADHNSGWREEADTYDSVDLPNGDFDYDDFVREEFGKGAKQSGLQTAWTITALVVLATIIALYFYAVR